MKTKKIFTIGEPCQEDWQNMTPTEQGRYCDVCAKCVVDLRGKSQQEIHKLYVENDGNLCGTMSTNQYNQSQEAVAQAKARMDQKAKIAAGADLPPMPTVKKLATTEKSSLETAVRIRKRFNLSREGLRRLQIFAASFIAAFGMFWGSTVDAQSHPRKLGKIAMPLGSRVSGTVLHEGKPVEGAAVYAYHNKTGERFETRTPADGRFHFRDLDPGEWTFSAWNGHDLEGSAVRTLTRGEREEIKIEMDMVMILGDIAPLEPMEVPEDPVGPEIIEPEPKEPCNLPVPGGIRMMEEPVEEAVPELGEIEFEWVEEEVEINGGISYTEEVTDYLGNVAAIEEPKEEPILEPGGQIISVEIDPEDMIDGGITFVEWEEDPPMLEITPMSPLPAELILQNPNPVREDPLEMNVWIDDGSLPNT